MAQDFERFFCFVGVCVCVFVFLCVCVNDKMQRSNFFLKKYE